MAFSSLLSDCLRASTMLVSSIWPPRNVAVPGQLAINSIEHALNGVGLDQALLEGPDRRPVRDLAAGA
jgi:hypothetical protein